eukprot:gnl/Chilomastix_cuspidata/296.p1 GENE.gnl/Chilomastix_cuspidata/296~~gnl/Chilomastix_cuspidata/296.p1  ORF type:complete len:1068 (+),score=414.28 gnl/Chilomastix_cuspidata/296:44-3247(+)
MSDRVRVCCRFRPLNAREERIKERPPLERVSDTKVKFGTDARKSELREWEYDRIFYPTSTQEDVYEYAARPILDSCFEGYNGTIFAYGQTGSGKTFSMVGPEEYVTNNALWGITPRLIHDLFARIADSPSHFQFSVKISYVELYRERLHDLLNMQNANLEIRQALNGDIFIKNVTEVYAGSADEVLNVFQRGDRNRFTAATTMNERSSRSHAILTLQLTQQDMRGEEGAKTSRIFLVDLAGSERLNDTQATGDRLKEAQQINQSLSALGNVIKALTDPKKRHVPYRDSKLTRLLQDSLGGNAKTIMVACCSPADMNFEETLSTLKYASRARRIQNRPEIVRNTSHSIAASLRGELERMAAHLKQVEKERDSALSSNRNLQFELRESRFQTAELLILLEDMQNELAPAPVPVMKTFEAPSPFVQRLPQIIEEDRRHEVSARPRSPSESDVARLSVSEKPSHRSASPLSRSVSPLSRFDDCLKATAREEPAAGARAVSNIVPTMESHEDASSEAASESAQTRDGGSPFATDTYFSENSTTPKFFWQKERVARRSFPHSFSPLSLRRNSEQLSSSLMAKFLNETSEGSGTADDDGSIRSLPLNKLRARMGELVCSSDFVEANERNELLHLMHEQSRRITFAYQQLQGKRALEGELVAAKQQLEAARARASQHRAAESERLAELSRAASQLRKIGESVSASSCDPRLRPEALLPSAKELLDVSHRLAVLSSDDTADAAARAASMAPPGPLRYFQENEALRLELQRAGERVSALERSLAEANRKLAVDARLFEEQAVRISDLKEENIVLRSGRYNAPPSYRGACAAPGRHVDNSKLVQAFSFFDHHTRSLHRVEKERRSVIKEKASLRLAFERAAPALEPLLEALNKSLDLTRRRIKIVKRKLRHLKDTCPRALSGAPGLGGSERSLIVQTVELQSFLDTLVAQEEVHLARRNALRRDAGADAPTRAHLVQLEESLNRLQSQSAFHAAQILSLRENPALSAFLERVQGVTDPQPLLVLLVDALSHLLLLHRQTRKQARKLAQLRLALEEEQLAARVLGRALAPPPARGGGGP